MHGKRDSRDLNFFIIFDVQSKTSTEKHNSFIYVFTFFLTRYFENE